MTAEELLAAVQASSHYWIQALNLTHWRIDIAIVDGFDDDRGVAACEPDDDFNAATIKIHENVEMLLEPDQTLDYIVVHELLHCHLRDLDEVFTSAVGPLGYLASQGYRERWRHEEEQLIDMLAHVLVARGPGVSRQPQGESGILPC